MKVLWVSNSPIGPAASILSEEYKGSSGGWIQSEYEYLDKANIEMTFMCFVPKANTEEVLVKSSEIGTLYGIRSVRMQNGFLPSKALIRTVERVVKEVSPDVIHIWGTETCLSNAVSKVMPDIPKVIFIQGLLGVHRRYLGGYFDPKHHKNLFSKVPIEGKLRAWVRRKLFERQAEIEKQTIENCERVIIDSEFAEAYCKSVSPQVKCYYRVLMPNSIFDEYKWRYENAHKHQIFTVYGSNAEKGVQQLLLAVGLILDKYPDIKVLVPGTYNVSDSGQLIPSQKSEYEVVLLNLINKLGLQKNVVFTGRLSPANMAKQISQSHIFVNPSCMEVHALSLREAMKMGVPCITALCGSTGNYVKHGENGLIYRYEEHEMLALYIDKLFSNEELCSRLSCSALSALDDYQLEKRESLLSIYNDIVESVCRVQHKN